MTDKPTRHLRVFPPVGLVPKKKAPVVLAQMANEEGPGHFVRKGCIPPDSLRDLAIVMDGLVKWHDKMDGRPSDLPCLRRVEMDDGRVLAHVSSGPDIGGHWYRFLLGPLGWKLEEEER